MILDTATEDDDTDDTGRKHARDDAWKLAHTYAWEMFKYHAQQRQAVFRFYLILVGAIVAGLSASGEHSIAPSWVFGLALMIVSFLFWRLDVRNTQLVDAAAAYLLLDEKRIATEIGNEAACILAAGDRSKTVVPIFLPFNSFRRVYGWCFMLVGTAGGVILYPAVAGLPGFLLPVLKVAESYVFSLRTH
jgi:hypothetical protein